MKTNRFEEILRRKLESIQPDFQDQEWDKWQSFKQVHGSPSFWQSYGQWLGYAVATITTAVMVVLYVNQSIQNEALLNEMEGLKQQMTAQSNGKPASDSLALTETGPIEGGSHQVINSTPDTVYIIERQTVYREVPFLDRTHPEASVLGESRPLVANPTSQEQIVTEEIPAGASEKMEVISEVKNNASEKSTQIKGSPVPETEGIAPDKTQITSSETKLATGKKSVGESSEENNLSKKLTTTSVLPSTTSNPTNTQGRQIQKTSPSIAENRSLERVDLGDLAVPSAQEFSNSRNFLYRRLQGRMPQKTRSSTTSPSIAKTTPNVSDKPVKGKAKEQRVAEMPTSNKKVEEAKKEENLLPKFGLNLPYRVGVGQQWEGNTKAFTVWNEVLLGKHWAMQTGFSWHKLEEMKFFSEKMFRDDMREDIRQEHANKLPPSFEIFNITTQTTQLQIPLGITYRGDLGNYFTYMIGTSTNLNARTKQLLTFDFKRPTKDYGQQSAERLVHIPIINNVLFSAGIEKRWSPLVLQANSFVETRIKTFPFLKDHTNVGFQVKLLYEFGGGKKN